MITLGALLYAIGTVFFIFPNEVLLGGTSGISLILERWIPLSPGTILAVLGILLVVLAFLVLGTGMGIRTLIGSVLTSVFISAVEQLFPLSSPPVSNSFLSAIIGASIIAIASGILFFVDSNSGGTDIVAFIVKKYADVNIGLALLITDVIIVIIGGILSGWYTALVSALGFSVKVFGIDAVIFMIRKLVLKRAKKESKNAV